MPFCKVYPFFVIVHYNLFDWIKAKLLHSLFSYAVTDFFWEDIICHHDYFRKLISDERLKHKDKVAELAEK